jgi:hypothetical protein
MISAAVGSMEVESTGPPLVDVWLLESYREFSDGQPSITPFGEAPKGILIYTADGFVSAQLMLPNRPMVGSEAWDAESRELGEMAKGYIAYCGRYSVNPERREVVHRPMVALVPDLINHDQPRGLALTGDRLTLTTHRTSRSGELVTTDLVWRRLPKADDSPDQCEEGSFH